MIKTLLSLPVSIRWSAVSIAGYALTAGLLLPSWLQRQAPDWFQSQTGHTLSVKRIHLNPFTANLQLDDLQIHDDHQLQFLKFETLTVNFNLIDSLLTQTLSLDHLQIQNPSLRIEHYGDNRYNVSQLVPQQTDPKNHHSDDQPTTPIGLKITTLDISNGQLDWLESPKHGPQTETLVPLNLHWRDVDSQHDQDSHFELGFNLASGGHIQWQGILNMAKLSGNGSLQCENLDLNKLWHMFDQQANVPEVTAGTLNAQAVFSWDAQTALATFRLEQAQAQLQNLHLKDPQLGEAAIDHARLSVQDWRIDPQQHSQALASASLQITTLNLATPDPDKKLTPLTISQLDTGLSAFNQQTRPFNWYLKGTWFEHGRFDFQGETLSNLYTSQIKTRLDAIKLKPLMPWFGRLFNLELVDGELSMQGDLGISESRNLHFQGNANLNNLITRDNQKHKDFLKWAALKAENIVFDQQAPSLSLQTLSFEQPYLRVTINQDGSNNFTVLKQTSVESGNKVSSTAKPETTPDIQIESVQIMGGETDFSDYSLLLPFTTHIRQLTGELKDLKSTNSRPARLKLQGHVFDSALVKIDGLHQLKTGDSDIKLDFKHMPLPLITPYMAEFSGYRIEKGQMTLDLHYQIHDGKLDAHNQLFIDQLALGEQVNNPHARSLPIKLAIALLKDSSGKINLNFPISGSLDDPHFNFETFIADAAGNLITKIASSPFSMFGSLLEQDKDYSNISFQAGSSELSISQQQKLSQLALALNTKPQLSIDIKALAYQNQDWPVIRFDSIYDILQQMKSGELRDRGQQIRHEYIQLDDSEYRRLLIKFFKEVYPDELGFSLLGKPKVKSQPEAEFFTLAKHKLELAMPPEPARLNNLAIARANAIAGYLIENGHINREKIFILATDVLQLETAEINAQLTLNAGH